MLVLLNKNVKALRNLLFEKILNIPLSQHWNSQWCSNCLVSFIKQILSGCWYCNEFYSIALSTSINILTFSHTAGPEDWFFFFLPFCKAVFSRPLWGWGFRVVLWKPPFCGWPQCHLDTAMSEEWPSLFICVTVRTRNAFAIILNITYRVSSFSELLLSLSLTARLVYITKKQDDQMTWRHRATWMDEQETTSLQITMNPQIHSPQMCTNQHFHRI